jgi:hypothetical protein
MYRQRIHPLDCGQPLADRAVADVLNPAVHVRHEHRLERQRSERGKSFDDRLGGHPSLVDVAQRKRIAAVELHEPLVERAQRHPYVSVHASRRVR